MGNILTFGGHLSTDLDTRSGESFAHISRSHTKQVGNLVSNWQGVYFSLLISWLLDILHVTHHDYTTSDFIRVITFRIREAENLEGFSCAVEFKNVIHVVNNDHTLTCPVVLFWIAADHTHIKYSLLITVHDLVEDVVISFSRKLEDYTRLFKQVDLNITSSKFTSVTKVDTNELTKARRVVVTD